MSAFRGKAGKADCTAEGPLMTQSEGKELPLTFDVICDRG